VLESDALAADGAVDQHLLLVVDRHDDRELAAGPAVRIGQIRQVAIAEIDLVSHGVRGRLAQALVHFDPRRAVERLVDVSAERHVDAKANRYQLVLSGIAISSISVSASGSIASFNSAIRQKPA